MRAVVEIWLKSLIDEFTLGGLHSALVAFFLLFSTVRFQMCPQIACLRRCKVALVAFG